MEEKRLINKVGGVTAKLNSYSKLLWENDWLSNLFPLISQ
jgi:hypothetical protein